MTGESNTPDTPDGGEWTAAYLQQHPPPTDETPLAGRAVLFVKGNWRHDAARAIYELQLTDEAQARRLFDLKQALRSGLTPQECRVVAYDILGEQHVEMTAVGRGGPDRPMIYANILVPQRYAREMAGKRLLILADGDGSA